MLDWDYSYSLALKIVEINEYRQEKYDEVVHYLYLKAGTIVEDYILARNAAKLSDSSFRFWTHFPIVERGASSAVIRWRRYTGRGKFSEPVPTSGLKNYKLPMKLFTGCTKKEREVIADAEERFSVIRRMNEKLLIINKAHHALLDLSGARAVISEMAAKNSSARDLLEAQSDRLPLLLDPGKEFTEKDRLQFRRNLGLDP
ncbi:hypothetical protein [Methylophaga sp.]|uniref:hypothetical protein n=1 Tax=Methylophaga sp. TaxID=2024840 RepID=UPI003A935CBB